MNNLTPRGSIIAVEQRHSSTDAKFKTSIYYTYHLAECTSATKEGLCKKFRLKGQIETETRAPWHKVLSISESHQAAARKLYDISASVSWPSKDHLIAAIKQLENAP